MSEPETGHAESLASVRAVVGRLRARHEEIAQTIDARIQEAVPDPTGGPDPDYRAGVLAAVTAVLGHCLEAIEHNPGWSAPVPAEAAAQARRAARAGVSLGTVLRRYVAADRRLGQFVTEEAVQIGLSGNAPALQHLHVAQQLFLEHLTANIEHEYLHELERVGRCQRRLEIAKRLLSNNPVASAELAELDYELDASWHLGLIATGATAENAVRELNARLAYNVLQMSCGDETVWAWLGGSRKIAVADIESEFSTHRPVGVSLAVGEPAWGIDGWRQTHRSAWVAHLVARCRPSGLTRYLDVALEATQLQDDALAEVLVNGYLSPLDDERGGGLARRRTLRAIFDAEHNVSSAASALKVDRRTVHRWLGEIERRLGYRLHERQAEIEIALRLEELRGARGTSGPWPRASA
jgi:hypothetical protein